MHSGFAPSLFPPLCFRDPASVMKMTLSPARCFILLLILSFVDAGEPLVQFEHICLLFPVFFFFYSNWDSRGNRWARWLKRKTFFFFYSGVCQMWARGDRGRKKKQIVPMPTNPQRSCWCWMMLRKYLRCLCHTAASGRIYADFHEHDGRVPGSGLSVSILCGG